MAFLSGVCPTWVFGWEDLARVEPLSWGLARWVGNGVRFGGAEPAFVFVTLFRATSEKILDSCEAASRLRAHPDLVSRTSQRMPLFGAW